MPAEGVLDVEGHAIRVTNLDRVLYPDSGVTKSDVITYYAQVAARMLPVVRDRPVTRVRWPHGVSQEPFFEKHLPSHAPDWLRRFTWQHSEGPITFPFVDSAAGLVWFAQHNALELHVPQWRWTSDEMTVDRLVLDLDPGPGVGLTRCAEVATWLRDVLAAQGAPCAPVTSGSKGIHLYARWPIGGHDTTSHEYAKVLAQACARQFPSLVTAVMTKSARDNRVFLDWSQNNVAKTTIAPYSLRGRPEPYVAAPRTWEELADPDVRHLTMDEVLARLANTYPLDTLVTG